QLVYALRLANSSPWDLELTQVATFSNDAFVFGLGDKELGKRFSIGGRRGAEKTTLTAGQFGVLFVHIGGLSETAVQTSIAHRIVVRRVDTGQDFTIWSAGQSALNKPTNLVLGPPLKGEGYLAGDGCCD